MAELIFVKAFRIKDKRDIYLKIHLSLDEWVNVVNTLIDSEFEILSIKNIDYNSALEKNKNCYHLESYDYHKFISFITGNYLSLNEIFQNSYNSKKI